MIALRAAFISALALAAASASASAAWTAPATVAGSAGNRPNAIGGNQAGDQFLLGAGWISRQQFTATRIAGGQIQGGAQSVFSGFPADNSGWWGNPGPAAVSANGRFIAAESGTALATGGQVRLITGRFVGGVATGVKVAKTITGEYARTLSVAINDRGDAAAMWATYHGSWAKTFVAFSKSGSAFGKTTTLSAATYRAAGTVVLNAAGDAAMGWEQNRGSTRVRDVRGAIRTASGRFTAPRIIGPTYAFPKVKIILDAKRNATIACFTQASGEGAVGGATDVWFATLKSTGSLVAPTHVETHSTPIGSEGWAIQHAGLALLPESDGRQLLLWTGWDGSTYAVFARLTTLSERARVSPAGVNALLQDAATEPGGAVVALWNTGQHGSDRDGTPMTVAAALSADAGQTWEAPMTLDAAAETTVSGIPEVRGAISAGKAVAVWGTDGNPYLNLLSPPLVSWSASPLPLGGE